MYEIKRAKRFLQDFVHFVTARASLFTDHKISGLPIRAKYSHFRTIYAQTVDNPPTDSFSSSLKLMVIHAWRCDFVQLLRRCIWWNDVGVLDRVLHV